VVSVRDLGLWYLAAPTDSMRSVSISSIHSCKGRRILLRKARAARGRGFRT
jgi:hypothetical protein